VTNTHVHLEWRADSAGREFMQEAHREMNLRG
jgi:hypothetical protein